jgi:hypothetical protein
MEERRAGVGMKLGIPGLDMRASGAAHNCAAQAMAGV